jgi:hypothetical protein
MLLCWVLNAGKFECRNGERVDAIINVKDDEREGVIRDLGGS